MLGPGRVFLFRLTLDGAVPGLVPGREVGLELGVEPGLEFGRRRRAGDILGPPLRCRTAVKSCVFGFDSAGFG